MLILLWNKSRHKFHINKESFVLDMVQISGCSNPCGIYLPIWPACLKGLAPLFY